MHSAAAPGATWVWAVSVRVLRRCCLQGAAAARSCSSEEAWLKEVWVVDGQEAGSQAVLAPAGRVSLCTHCAFAAGPAARAQARGAALCTGAMKAGRGQVEGGALGSCAALHGPQQASAAATHRNAAQTGPGQAVSLCLNCPRTRMNCGFLSHSPALAQFSQFSSVSSHSSGLTGGSGGSWRARSSARKGLVWIQKMAAGRRGRRWRQKRLHKACK